MFKHIKSDLPASIVVFFVALPLCLGIALASGAPLFSGLIAGIVGGIVVGAMSGSNIGVSGPAAGLAAIVLVAITALGGYQNFLVAVVIGGVWVCAVPHKDFNGTVMPFRCGAREGSPAAQGRLWFVESGARAKQQF